MKKIFFIVILIFLNKYIISQWSIDQSLSNLGPTPSISAVSSSIAWVAGNANSPVIYKSTNGGQNWVSVPVNGIANVGLYSLWAVDANTAFVGDGTGNAKVYKTTNGGTNWNILFTSGGTASFFNGIVFSRSNPSLGIAQCDPPNGAGNNFYLQITANSGTNWNLLNPAPPGYAGYVSGQHSPFFIDNNFYGFGFNGGGIAEITTNGGVNWFNPYLGRNGFVSAISFSTNKINGIAAVNQSGLSRTTNSGVNWTTISVPVINGQFIPFCYWVPTTNIVYASASGGGISRSTDGGLTWTTMNTSGQNDIRHMDFVINIGLIYGYAICNSGVTLTLIDTISALPVQMNYFNYTVNLNDVGLRWETSSEINNSGFKIERSYKNNGWEEIGFVKGSGNKATSTIYGFGDNNLKNGSYKYKLKQTDYNGNYEYFELNSEVVIAPPVNFALLQNNPNPFNPSTKIKFDIPNSSFVQLTIYDAMGKEVTKLVNEELKPGNYSVDWNADNYTSGVYFYKLQAGSLVETNKMILIK